MHPAATRYLCTLFALACASSVHSAGNAGRTGPATTFGPVSHAQLGLSNSGNPAAQAYDRSRMDQDDGVIGGLHLGAGLEYGNVSELFDKVDDIADSLLSDSGLAEKNIYNIDFNNPDLNGLVDAIDQEADRVDDLLASIGDSGYANATVNGQIPIVFAADVFGGTLGVEYRYAATASAVALPELLNFDTQAALTALQTAFDPNNPQTSYDLTGGVTLAVDPLTGDVAIGFDNDSTLLTRAAKISEFGVSWSKGLNMSGGKLFFGVTPKYTSMGLSNVASRVGDITDAEELFDDIRDASFKTEGKIGLDAGLLWVAQNYRLGVTGTNLLEPSFKFPALDTSGFTNPAITAQLAALETYTLERQFTLEGGLFTADHQWSLNIAYDTQAITDPIGKEAQWLSISGGWHSDNFWLPNVRLGYHKNQTGSELGYYAFGLTLFGYVNLDLGYSPDKVTIDGDSLPRGASASLGFNFGF
ncbi:conjugal transfer protein TraF [Simiduia agarivorans]|uniref:Plasmid transfer operon, TraF, protein n=1 Tax=Simiduia agarivorans (strain DSM 21679 / JCM 13881 / BCRC 17597 / SA1) TaxID=1117647 RepID=K4KJY8_SIMAS|nr:conjugal transfer protein TraF [Simiduia agarivorans]AFU99474.2 hypothetical protein M5M_11485 [Simiduia agarivorans SA1 = DSM 21679]